MEIAGFNNKKFRGDVSVPVLLVVFLLYILVCTLSPFTFSLESSRSLFGRYDEKFETFSALWSLPAWDIVTNILLFVPFGFLFGALPVLSPYKSATKILYSTLTAYGLSFIIESCQLFLPRNPSIVDIFLNAVGGMTGAVVGTYVYAPLSQLTHRRWVDIQNSQRLPQLIMGYAIVCLAPSVLGLPLVLHVRNWEPRQTFELLEGIITGKYRWAYWFFVIFPVGFLFYLLFLRSKNDMRKAAFLSALIGLPILCIIEGLQVFILRRDIDFFFLSVGTGVVLLSILTSSILSQRARVS